MVNVERVPIEGGVLPVPVCCAHREFDANHCANGKGSTSGYLEDRGFVAIDFLRVRVWEDPRVALWYAQNIWIAAREQVLSEIPSLIELRDHGPPPHPQSRGGTRPSGLRMDRRL